MFASKGFSAATVRDVADEADMLSGSLYYYFDSKEAMVEAVVVEYLDRLIRDNARAVEESEGPVEILENLIAVGLRGLTTYRSELTILQNDWPYVRSMPGVAERLPKVESVWLESIQRGVEEGLIRPVHDVRMIYRTLMGAVQGAVRWFDPKGKVGIDDVIAVQTTILLSGIKVDRD
nr:TetR/AcrR family transcriptional regulator [Actinomadura rugatobispora]